jgi:type IV secretion system protein VirB4
VDAGRRRATSPRASIHGLWKAIAHGCSITKNDHLDLDTRIAGFDMTHLLEDPVVRTPTMMYLFHRVEERLNGQPSIIVVDEGWKALDDEVFVARIRDWEKTIRKRNGIVGS